MKRFTQFLVLTTVLLLLIKCKEISTTTTLSENIKHEHIGTVNFPSDWIGEWSGILEIWSVDSILQQIPMKLIITPNDSCYNWNIIYEQEIPDSRQYKLRTVDSTLGHYQIDELNGIVLDTWKKGNGVTSAFEMDNLLLVISYTMIEDSINYEVKVLDLNKKTITGENNPELDFISNYTVTSYQKAILKKKKNA
jgi:hypothetical protein